MKAVPVLVYYSVLRVVMFAVPLVILLALGVEWWLAAVLAAVIGLSLSVIFLRNSRNGVARDLYETRHRGAAEPASGASAATDAMPAMPVTDAETEDAAVDRRDSPQG